MRQMPNPGIYVLPPNKIPGFEGEVLIATGTKKGNSYWRPYMSKTATPTYLQWTCLPSNKDISANYIMCNSLTQALSHFK